MAFLLNSQAVLLCPHGGKIRHIPHTFTTYRINGYPPLLLTDTYHVLGCSFLLGGTGLGSPPMNCHHVHWLTGSSMMMVKGSPVLTNTSTGLCMSVSNTPGGPVVIASSINIEEEPRDFTNITD